MLFLAAILICIACDDEIEIPECYCSNGGNIGGWEEEENKDAVNDSISSGWDVTLKEWNDSIENREIEI